MEGANLISCPAQSERYNHPGETMGDRNSIYSWGYPMERRSVRSGTTLVRLGLVLAMATVIASCASDGKLGATGATGASGLDGATGATGASGLDGATGAAGAPGLDGAAGASGVPGTPGAPGAPGFDASNPPAAWADPTNISFQVSSGGNSAYGQQSVFTPNGRMHVVYYAYDPTSGYFQLYYTSAAAPYSAWGTPVLVTNSTDDDPDWFDLAAAADNSVHIVYARNTVTTSYLRYVNNSGGTFTDTLVYEELSGTGNLFAGRILMRGTTAHVVWTGYDGGANYYYAHSNSSGTWPTVTPTTFENPSNYVSFDHFTFVSDAAGDFHFVYYVTSGIERVLYRGLPTGAGAFGSAQDVSDSSQEDVDRNVGAPIVQFDGSNNVYVFWKDWDAAISPTESMRCNIKAAGASPFVAAKTTIVTDHPYNNDTVGSGYFANHFDVQVASDGRIHATWKQDNNSYGNSGLYPMFYRTKAPGTDASVGWDTAEVAAWLKDPLNSVTWNGGVYRSALVRPAADGTIHVFYADATYNQPNGEYVADLFHSYRNAAESTWHGTGSASKPTTEVAYPKTNAGDITWPYFLDVGIEASGLPYVLFATDPYNYGGNSLNGDVFYTHRFAGAWAPGANVDGADHVDAYGDFWLGDSPGAGGTLHAIWQQEVDPFDNSGTYDLMHSFSPTVSTSGWRIGR
jgi:hypothetical protein